MEVKKSPQADLERNKMLFTLMGYILALAVVYVGFEWSTGVIRESRGMESTEVFSEEEIIPITRQEVYIPPPPPPEQVNVLVEQINIVENKQTVSNVNILSTEDDPSKRVDIQQQGTGTGTATYVKPEEESPEEQVIFTIVEEMPMFPGGDAALFAFISNNIRYPAIALENGIQGRVICEFVVNREGKVTEAKVIRGVDPALDAEALRVINSMPNWKAGKQRGKPVKVRYTLPVTFKLQ